MSIFEWLGESSNPGPVGRAEFGPRKRGDQTRFTVLLRAFLSFVLIGAAIWLLAEPMGIRGLSAYLYPSLGFLVYCLIAYFVHPEPDESNMGLIVGLFDHPFRYSDDHNRFLLFLMIFLMPGRFISEAAVDTCTLIWNAARKSPKKAELE